MNTGQRPLSVGEKETHMSPSIVTRDNNRYTLLHALSYLHTLDQRERETETERDRDRETETERETERERDGVICLLCYVL